MSFSPFISAFSPLGRIEESGGDLPTPDGVRRNNIFTSSTSGIQTVDASSESGSLPAWEATDGVTASSGSRWRSTSALPQWLRLDFGEDQFVNSVKIYNHSNGAPTDFTFESSPDGSTWTVRGTETDADISEGWRTYSLDDPAVARWWRVNISDSDAGTFVHFREIEFLS